MTKRIFIIDDDPDMVRVATDVLTDEGYVVESAHKPSEALEKILARPPDAIILDVRLPEKDGFEVLKDLKSNPKTARVPVIMISVKSDVSDVVVGLEIGADDYIRKPFEKRELIARLKTVLRRKAGEPERERIELGPLAVDFSAYIATIDGQAVKLTPKEFELLGFFMRREGRVLTRPSISEHVWGVEYNPSSETIEFHVKQLRRKLGAHGHFITVLKGVGYRFEVV